MVAKWSFVKHDSDLYKYVSTIKKEYHPLLRNNRIAVLWRADPDFGQIAMTQVVPPIFRFLTQVDALLIVHKGAWEHSLNEEQKAYYIDHALEMIDASDKYMDDGRPKLVTVQPEKVGFASVIKRHGTVTTELQQYQTAFVESLQMDIFTMMRDAYPEQFEYKGFNFNDVDTEQRFGQIQEVNKDNEMELFLKAARLIMQENKASSLLLQLHLNINYQTASMLMDSLIDAKFITPFDPDSFGHKVLATDEMLQFYQDAEKEAAAAEEQNDDQTKVGPHVLGQVSGNDNVVPFASR